jgi:hypothetical protein
MGKTYRHSDRPYIEQFFSGQNLYSDDRSNLNGECSTLRYYHDPAAAVTAKS